MTGLGYFVTASHLEEDGWRDFSPTDAQQIFAKLTSLGDGSRYDVSLTRVDTDLVGNGAAPEDLLELDREAIFTRPDRTENTLTMLNVAGEQTVSSTITLRGNLYVRASDIDTLNGDDSDFEECEDTPGFICEEEGDDEELALDENDQPIPADDELEGATVNRTDTEQNGGGFALQADFTGALAGRDNRFTIGATHDDADVEFGASTELGALDATRQAIPGGVFVGEGFTGLETSTCEHGTLREQPLHARRARRADGVGPLESHPRGARGSDRRRPRRRPHVPTLQSRRSVSRWVPDAATFYAGYSEASRAPSPVELTCADEDDPCRLPNAFVADPPLEQVVAKTFEAGVRGAFGSGRWHAGVFRTTNDDDILFISAGALTNQGFFDNVGETRRDGIELNLAGAAGERLAWSIDYTYLDATFNEDFVVASANHPGGRRRRDRSRERRPLAVDPRAAVEGRPALRHDGRLYARRGRLCSSGAHFRGDEGNLLDELDGYSLVSVRAEYRLGERAHLFASIDNLLDEEYETFGVFGEADDVLGDDFDEPFFVGPGAPRAAWIGVRVEF